MISSEQILSADGYRPEAGGGSAAATRSCPVVVGIGRKRGGWWGCGAKGGKLPHRAERGWEEADRPEGAHSSESPKLKFRRVSQKKAARAQNHAVFCVFKGERPAGIWGRHTHLGPWRHVRAHGPASAASAASLTDINVVNLSFQQAHHTYHSKQQRGKETVNQPAAHEGCHYYGSWVS